MKLLTLIIAPVRTISIEMDVEKATHLVDGIGIIEGNQVHSSSSSRIGQPGWKVLGIILAGEQT
jgi:hypothetical protein